MKDFGNVMRQAQKMKAELERLQGEAAAKRVEGTAGGGMVTVTADGRGEVVAVRIDPEVAAAGDLEMLQDLVVAATNEALRKARELMNAEMAKLAGGMGIPGLF
jgi:DNA-binding YbaB/EbfC family protein